MSLLERARRYLATRRYAYRKIFSGPLSEIVLRDLATYCSADTTAYQPGEREHVLAEGRRQVWLRINHHLHLSEAELWKFYDGREDDVAA